MGFRFCLASLFLAGVAAADEIVFEQPHDLSGTLYQSSWWAPDDSDYDQWVWDNFTLSADTAITQITWRGGYIYGGYYTGTVDKFTVAIYRSIGAGTEPDIVYGPLVEYRSRNNAGETLVGTFGGTKMYDYHFTLPSPFQAAAGTKYWVQIEAWQYGLPEWGLAKGTGGNGSHFRWLRGGHMYQHVPGDAAFALLAAAGSTYTIAASASPPEGGTVQGAGEYPPGSQASLAARPNSGFGFVNWTENGVQVSRNSTYTFTVTGDRTLVANFTPAYTITTSAAPSYAGTTTGDGIYNGGDSVTVEAATNAGFAFVNWTWLGLPVSDAAVYTFTASRDLPLVANYAALPATAVFDFDNAPVHRSLPIDLTVDGVTAHLSATDGGYSIQYADTMGFTPEGFAGLCIYPNTVFRADLLAGFSQMLTRFTILYSPQELGCDDSATMRVTAYKDGVFVKTRTTTARKPGTWPTEWLEISVADGFNSVVVHYDAPPPTCQDYGVIFLADNMIVDRGCGLPGDIDGDCRVDLADLAALVGCLQGPGVACAPQCAPLDLDLDGDLDLQDFAQFQTAFTGN
ncbi:MAG: hypothetical protein IT449_09150 [Phycisphaerales bacterium]|nr:hypothetical protein [Phycisphaerales bacterium]